MNRKTKNLWLICISTFFGGLIANLTTKYLFNNLEISTLKAIMGGSFLANITLIITSLVFKMRLKKNGINNTL
jgi:uncharacterized membrane protein YjjP (DUF1212 family)